MRTRCSGQSAGTGIVEEDFSTHVKAVRYRTIENGVKQMVVSVPRLNAGDTATAFVTFEVTKRTSLPPTDTTVPPTNPPVPPTNTPAPQPIYLPIALNEECDPELVFPAWQAPAP